MKAEEIVIETYNDISVGVFEGFCMHGWFSVSTESIYLFSQYIVDMVLSQLRICIIVMGYFDLLSVKTLFQDQFQC